MSKMQRVMLIVVCWLLVATSLPYLMLEDLYWHVNKTPMTLNVIVSLGVITYNLMMLHVDKTYIVVIADRDNGEK